MYILICLFVYLFTYILMLSRTFYKRIDFCGNESSIQLNYLKYHLTV